MSDKKNRRRRERHVFRSELAFHEVNKTPYGHTTTVSAGTAFRYSDSLRPGLSGDRIQVGGEIFRSPGALPASCTGSISQGQSGRGARLTPPADVKKKWTYASTPLLALHGLL